MPLLNIQDTHATKIAYDRAGASGPCVLLLQGVGCVGEGWRPQIDDLAKDHQVAWLDNRGIGGSVPLGGPVSIEEMAHDAQALMAHLGWRRVHLVGHSMGGLIVQQVARDTPQTVASLSLLSTLRRGRDAAVPTLANLKVSLRALFGTERQRWLTLARLGYTEEYLAAIPEEEALRLVQLTFCRDFLKTPPVLRQQVAALFRHRGGDMAPLQKIPTLIVTGTRDIVVRTELSEELRSHLPHARLERFTDAGHAVPLQHAAAVNSLLRAHIAAAAAD